MATKNLSKSALDHLSLSDEVRSSLLRNKSLIQNLTRLVGVNSKVSFTTEKSNLLVYVSRNEFWVKEGLTNITLLKQYIIEGKITKIAQIEEASKYFEKNPKIDEAKFEKFCGIGIEITDEEIKKAIDEVIEPFELDLKSKKWEIYPKIRPSLMKNIREASPWADGKKRTALFNEKIAAIIGPRPAKLPKLPPKKKSSKTEEKKTAPKNSLLKEHTGLEKYLSGRKLNVVANSPEIFEEHLARTGGVFRTRFPPEPNGFLHIGHAKSMNFNFSLAKAKKGVCFLRFDDTNPLTEKMCYIESIIDNVKWLGFEPAQTTYSSDYFGELYRLAVQMIGSGDAYVCHESQEEIRAAREHRIKTGEPRPSRFRGREPAENLRLFEKMRDGGFSPGEATLRMKGDLRKSNPNLWDPVAYRVIDSAHPHVGAEWKIYPSYDFTHCIVDSLEDMDASCCTLEFENRRESYFWLLDVLGLYKPVVWEFSRLNMDYNVMSKRRLNTLVEEKLVRGWDDPRLLTINGLRRRGFPAKAINLFCERVGVTRADNSYSPIYLNACAREVLDDVCPRSMCVLDPLKVVLVNFGERTKVHCTLFPKLGEKGGTSDETVNRTVYIERSDFREEDSKKFFGLAPGKIVRLKYAFSIRCDKVVYEDETDKITELHCSIVPQQSSKPKGVLHWVSAAADDLRTAEIRLYENLFLSQKPGSDGKDWKKDINPHSSKSIKRALISSYTFERAAKWQKAPWDCRFQFERVGYFCKDEDSAEGKLVFNRILPLREAKEKRETL